MVVLWFCGGFKVVLWWFCGGFVMVLQWFCGGSLGFCDGEGFMVKMGFLGQRSQVFC